MLSKDEIRLLDLLPSSTSDNNNDIVQCRTRITPLSTDCPYETLSYVWGDKKDCMEINVDGNIVAVTSNLAFALKQLRLPESTRTIWVDQLCIDQEDELEKGSQIPLMSHIYSHTSQCLIWLGQIPPNIPLSDAKSAHNFIHLLSEGKQCDAEQLRIALDLDAESSMPGPLRALESMCNPVNPWWVRLWTVQEAILPPRACVVWGELSIQWETMLSASYNFVMQPHSDVLDPHLRVINELSTQVIGIQISKESSLGPVDFPFRWRSRRVTEPLDKVYGLLGLFPQGKLPRSQAPDYRLSQAQVFAMFTVDLVESYRDLHAIAVGSTQRWSGSTKDLPGWALDMHGGERDLRMDGIHCCWHLMHSYYYYNAGGATTVDPNRVNYDRDSNTLGLDGFKVDEIALTVSKPIADEPDTSNVTCAGAAQIVREWYKVAEDFYQSHPWQAPQNGPQTWSEAFWTSLIGDNRVSSEFFHEDKANPGDIENLKRFVETGEMQYICYSLFGNIAYNKLIITTTGLLGFGPHHSEVGDQVWILHGGKTPFILRPVPEKTSSTDEFLFIGPSYVNGIMEGEATSLDKPVCQVVMR
ncbi:heterokaryon incompatibility protein-domain-containing protein [Nemania sp. FL0916]|nr:heterokaryon incompatibility protein-domain-containing protein [Nemania sp. FL0916]